MLIADIVEIFHFLFESSGSALHKVFKNHNNFILLACVVVVKALIEKICLYFSNQNHNFSVIIVTFRL